MEPKLSDTETTQALTSPAEGNTSIVQPTNTPSAVSISPEQTPTPTQNQISNTQIIEDLKNQRDELRGLNTPRTENETKGHKLKLFILIFIGLALVATYILLIKPRIYRKSAPTTNIITQKSFKLPSDIATKTSDEKTALNIIELARKNDPDEIINKYLNKAQLQQSEADFKSLVTSYSTSADGETIELIEKNVGKVDFAATGESSAIAETTSEFEAASLIYKSSYYQHTNNIFTKINLYKPDPAVDSWKMYTFEFKAGDTTSPLKASVEIPI